MSRSLGVGHPAKTCCIEIWSGACLTATATFGFAIVSDAPSPRLFDEIRMVQNKTLGVGLKGRYARGLLIVFAPWFLVVAGREVGPIAFPELADQFVLFISLFLVASFFLYSFGFSVEAYGPEGCRPVAPPAVVPDTRVLRRGYHFAFACAVVFSLVAFYDFLVVKGGSLSLGGIVEMRERENDAGPRGSLIGAVVALLAAAPPFLFVFALIVPRLGRVERLTAFSVVAVSLAAMFLSGGRNAFFISILFALSFYCFFLRWPPRNVRPPNPKRGQALLGKITVGIGLVAGFLYSMTIFLERAALQGKGPQMMLEHLRDDYGVGVYDVGSLGPLLDATYAATVYLLFYATHAFNYAAEYFARGLEPYLMGAYTFPQAARMADLVLSTTSFEAAQGSLLVVGAYLTLPVSLYLDFGHAGAIAVGGSFAFVFGFCMRNLYWLPLYQKMLACYLAVLFVFSPIYAVLGMANGFSMIFFIVAFVFLSLVLRSRNARRFSNGRA